MFVILNYECNPHQQTHYEFNGKVKQKGYVVMGIIVGLLHTHLVSLVRAAGVG